MKAYLVSVSAVGSYSGSYEVEAETIEDARRIALEHKDNRFREQEIMFEPTYDPFEEYCVAQIDSEDEEEQWYDQENEPKVQPMIQGNDDAICGELRDRGAHELAALSNQDIALRAQLGARVLEFILSGPPERTDEQDWLRAERYRQIFSAARSLGLLGEQEEAGR